LNCETKWPWAKHKLRRGRKPLKKVRSKNARVHKNGYAGGGVCPMSKVGTKTLSKCLEQAEDTELYHKKRELHGWTQLNWGIINMRKGANVDAFFGKTSTPKEKKGTKKC